MKNLFYGLLAVCMVLATWSCNEADINEDLSQEVTKNKRYFTSDVFTTEDENIKLGKKLQNPYTVTNMVQAYDNIKADLGEVINVRKTHLYVKFDIKTSEDIDILENEKGLELFVYPLDYEILNEGSYYDDQGSYDSLDLPDMYTCVDLAFQFPQNIEYTVLEDLYIPEVDSSNGNSATVLDLLDEEALRITNNIEDDFDLRRSSKWWRPRGTIKVFDDLMQKDIPLEGAFVRARRWFTWRKAKTDANGYFQMNKNMKRNVNYSIKWKGVEWTGGIHKWKARYRIRKGDFFHALYNGPKQKGDWNLTINSGLSLTFATVHRAGHKYQFGNSGGLRRPKDNSSFRAITIGVMDNNNKVGICFAQYWNWILVGTIYPEIKIWRRKKTDNMPYPTQNILATTYHELGHFSHFNWITNGRGIFPPKPIIRESWANAIEWHMTHLDYMEHDQVIYPSLVLDLNRLTSTQHWNHGGSNYTPCFIDMVDNHNQSWHTITGSKRSAVNCNLGGYNQQNLHGKEYCQLNHGNPPLGTTAFVLNNNLYYTPVNGNQCPMHGSSYDGANCFVSNTPQNVIPTVFKGNWYYYSEGDSDFPYDLIDGFTMKDLEDKVIPDAFGMTSYQNAIKQHKPWQITNRMIDKYFEIYHR